MFISSFYENEEKQIKKKEEKVKEDIETIPKELNSSISINENKLENHHCNNNQPFSIDHLKEYSPIDEYHFVHVFTDGSCLPSNPGPGGFAALFIFDVSF